MLRDVINLTVLAGCLIAAATVPVTARAAPESASAGGARDSCAPGMRGPPDRPMPMRRPGGDDLGPGGDLQGPPYLMDVTLTEDQEDKIFVILHAAAPILREQAKAAHKARQALHELGRSAQFDNAAAMMLAQNQAKAESQLALTRVRSEHDIYALLTAEQRARIVDRPPPAADRHPHEPPS